jgi:hypothetical protein
MFASLRTLYSFTVKDLLQLRRETNAFFTFGIALAATGTFIVISPGTKRDATALQLLFLSPAIVVGNLFTRCIENEVRVFVLLRMMLRSAASFLRLKFAVMAAVTIPILAAITMIMSVVLRASVRVSAVRFLVVSLAGLLECAVCLGLAALFTNLDQPMTSRNAGAPIWVHAGYWISAVPIASLQWCLEWLWVGNLPLRHASAAATSIAFTTAVWVLVLAIAGSSIFLLLVGCHRLARFD